MAEAKLGLGILRRAAPAACAAALALAAALAAAAPVAAAAEPGPIATFHYTGGPQVFTVPAGVDYLTFDVVGGRGGFPSRGGAGGPGGETIAGLDVSPGQKLTIWVGQNTGGSGGWGYTCGGDQGIATDNPRAYDGGGGGGSSAVTAGAWTQGAGSCAASTRPPGEPLIVAGGGGGGGGDERIPLTKYYGGSGGAGGNPAQPGFPGQGGGPGPGGAVAGGVGNQGGAGVSADDNSTDTAVGGGGGGGGGYAPAGNGGGGGGRLPSGNGNLFAGGGGAGGTSFAAGAAAAPIFLAGSLARSGAVTISAVHEEGFECTGSIQEPRFPAGVQYAHVLAEGGAGGKRSGRENGPSGDGGHGGIVSADLFGFAWNKLQVYVGCAGSDHGSGGGWGFGNGGGKGIASAAEADDGAGGGGGSGVEIGGFALVVAGGGGGGGGGAETLGETIDGGDGGDGGPPTSSHIWGHDGETEEGGGGGCPGVEWRYHLDAAAGGSSSEASGGGGGGGGGGGWGGACGGGGGNWPNGGGGGGGGGGSFALEHEAPVTNARFSTSSGVATDGKVLFSYVVSTPTHLSPYGGSGQQARIGATFARPLQALVVDQAGRPMSGIPVGFDITETWEEPGGQFAGGNYTIVVNSDAKGIATSPRVVANQRPGTWRVRAAANGVSPVEFALTNTPLPTATALQASPNPGLAGEPVLLKARVRASSGGPAPDGAVQFAREGEDLGAPVPLDPNDSAETAADLPLGTHAIEAVFLPEEAFASSSAKLTERVEKATSATAVTSSRNPSGFGQPVTFTAHVTHTGSRPAGGTVQFHLDGEPFGAPVPVSGGTATSQSTAALTIAAHEVTATYSGDEYVVGSEGRLTQSVGPDATATELTASANPAVFGQHLSYTATVKAPGVDTPSGTVRFLLDGGEACETTLAGGSASCELAAPLDPGAHEVRAEYAGDADFEPSHGGLVQTVAKARTATAVSADLATPRFGQPVAFTAAVGVLAPGGGVPTGEVQFFLGEEPLGSPLTIDGGVAKSPPLTGLPVGVDAVTAVYLGDAHHSGSEETLFEEVEPGATTTTLTSSANPTRFGVPVTFTAAVAPTAPAGGEPGGTVRFSLDGKAICDVPLDAAGRASCEAPRLYAGEHEVLAAYSGEADFEPSDGALTESIVKVPSRTVASTSASPVAAGRAVTLSAAVSAGLPDEHPAGTVTFSSGAQELGTAPVTPTVPGAGRARIETSALGPGSHRVVARYSGDEAIEPSASAPIAQVVESPPPAAAQAAAAACAPRQVRTRLLVFKRRNRVRLVARNRAEAPARVEIRFTEQRRRGKPRRLGTLRHAFAGKGTYRLSRRLPAARMKRLRRARGGLAARVLVAAAPGYCAERSERRLSVRRLVANQSVWFQADSKRSRLPRDKR